jgi:ketosteroid isomerase-like protein
MMVILALAAASSTPQCDRVPIGRMVATYADMIRRQDGASIAHLFGSDGFIDNPGAAPIRGEAAIFRFLSSFKGATVKSETMTIGNVTPDGAGWHVAGRFAQTGTTPAGKDYDVTGTFDSTWACTSDGWRVKRMATGK